MEARQPVRTLEPSNDATLDHRLDMSEGSYIVEGIAPHEQHIAHSAGLKVAEVRSTQRTRRGAGGSLQGLHRRSTPTHHGGQLSRKVVEGNTNHSSIGPGDKGDSGISGPLEARPGEREVSDGAIYEVAAGGLFDGSGFVHDGLQGDRGRAQARPLLRHERGRVRRDGEPVL